MTTLTPKNKTAALSCAIAFLNLSLFAIAGEMKNDASTSGKQNRIEIKDFAFNPQTITVKSGQTITWINRDEEPHTVVASRNSLRNRPRWIRIKASQLQLVLLAPTPTFARFIPK